MRRRIRNRTTMTVWISRPGRERLMIVSIVISTIKTWMKKQNMLAKTTS